MSVKNTFFLIGQFHMHLVSLEPTILHSTLVLQGEEVRFELECIDNKWVLKVLKG